jgi:spoIIIJ-associated protein
MELQQRVLEVSGEDVERAIQAGLADLQLSREEVSVEVLDEGSSGFLGFGGRDAVVRLTVKVDSGAGPVPESELVLEPSTDADTVPAALPTDLSEAKPAELHVEEEEGATEREVALEVVSSLLRKMQIDSEITLNQTEPDDLTGMRRWVINVSGQDLGILIGPRGETLNAFQYLARIMTGHKIQQRPNFIVDVEGYRKRREQALARLAQRMANKAVKQGRSIGLEPMPPNERRIIHLTLREDDRVYTESSGQGKYRKVRIYLKD